MVPRENLVAGRAVAASEQAAVCWLSPNRPIERKAKLPLIGSSVTAQIYRRERAKE